MSQNHGTHSPHIPYDPLPLAQDPRNTVYRDPPSPLASGFDTPPVELTSFPEGSLNGAMPPRFLPASQHFQGGSEYRDSFVSQNTFQTALSAPNSSIYALRPDSAAPESIEYRDDPDLDTADPSGPPAGYLEEKRSAYSSPRSKSKRTIMIFGAITAAIIVIVAVVVPVYLTVIKPKMNDTTTTSDSPSTTSGGTGSGTVAVVTGGNGSTITTENGTTFTYINAFGGTWYWDPNDPFNNNAQPNSWTPPLNQSFNFGTDKIFGLVIFDKFHMSSSDKCPLLQRQPRWLAYYRTSEFSISAVRFQLTSCPQFMQVFLYI